MLCWSVCWSVCSYRCVVVVGWVVDMSVCAVVELWGRWCVGALVGGVLLKVLKCC